MRPGVLGFMIVNKDHRVYHRNNFCEGTGETHTPMLVQYTEFAVLLQNTAKYCKSSTKFFSLYCKNRVDIFLQISF